MNTYTDVSVIKQKMKEFIHVLQSWCHITKYGDFETMEAQSFITVSLSPALQEYSNGHAYSQTHYYFSDV